MGTRCCECLPCHAISFANTNILVISICINCLPSEVITWSGEVLCDITAYYWPRHEDCSLGSEAFRSPLFNPVKRKMKLMFSIGYISHLITKLFLDQYILFMVYVLYVIDVMCQKITFCMLCHNTCSWITSWDIQCSQHMCCLRLNASIKTYMIFPLEIGWTWSNEREPDFICYSGRTDKPGPICRSHCLVQIFITEEL